MLRLAFLFFLIQSLFSQDWNTESIRKFHDHAFVADLHCDAIGRYLRGVDLAKDNSSGHVDLPKLKAGGIDLQVFACFSPAPQNQIEKWQSAKKVLKQIDAVYNLIENNK